MEKSRIFILRHGERVDYTFGKDWIKTCLSPEGEYIPNNLNLPLSLPKHVENTRNDTPLTRVGVFQSRLVGEGMANKNIDIEHVFCSPALRCLQTCQSFLKGYQKTSLPVAIEPGLFDPLVRFSVPDWLSEEEIQSLGLNVRKDYKKILSVEYLRTKHIENSLEDTYDRIQQVLNKLLKNIKKDGNILIVAHGTTIGASLRYLLGYRAPTYQEGVALMKYQPYCSYLEMEKDADSKNEDELKNWNIVDNSIPVLTHSEVKGFIWSDYQLKVKESLGI